MTDVVQKGLLPEYNAVIIDEAHNLIRSAYDQFKVEWDEKQVNYHLQSIDPSFPRSARWNNIIQSISDVNSEIGEQRDKLKDSVNDAKTCLEKMMNGLTEENENRFNTNNTYQDQPIFGNTSKVHAPIQKEIRDMRSVLEKILTGINRIQKIVLEMDNKRTEYPEIGRAHV